ncbi:hypothetical protein [Anaplasma phagocytophilum]|uniref:hypothetical protein n=1 Tax=Anaplasma phagocytophilum TaxID=948 RepID=UPI0005338F70|nr:hypothetical protein [Anaplasma phagocytophilum]KDB57302.1 hypothetical protein P030_05085 [Anaplasma phagocytophilum str. CRT35]
MHSSIGPISKTYRVYSNVEESFRSGKFTQRAVAVCTSWLLEEALERLRRVVEASEEGITSSLVKMALQNVRDIYSNIYKAREGTAENIKKALVDNGNEHISKLRTVLLYLAHARSKSLPNEGRAGASVTAISAASYNAASALSILQSNLGLPDEASVNTRDRLCVLLDSLSGSIELIPGRELLRSVRGSTGFISPSEVRDALLLAVEEARSLVYTTHDMADKDSRRCLQGTLEVLLYSIKRVIDGISQRQNISSRTSWSCALASQMMDTIQEVFDGYVSNTHTRDSYVSDKEFLSTNVIRAFTSARHLLASCISVPPEERPSSSEYVIQCSGMLREVYSHLGTRESIDLADPHDVNNILPALNKAREALNEVDPSGLLSHRDAETYSIIRDAIMQASERCIMRQCYETDLLDSELGATGWDALSIEGLGAAGASHDLHH